MFKVAFSLFPLSTSLDCVLNQWTSLEVHWLNSQSGFDWMLNSITGFDWVLCKHHWMKFLINKKRTPMLAWDFPFISLDIGLMRWSGMRNGKQISISRNCSQCGINTWYRIEIAKFSLHYKCFVENYQVYYVTSSTWLLLNQKLTMLHSSCDGVDS